jgi:hypothetical protein
MSLVPNIWPCGVFSCHRDSKGLLLQEQQQWKSDCRQSAATSSMGMLVEIWLGHKAQIQAGPVVEEGWCL